MLLHGVISIGVSPPSLARCTSRRLHHPEFQPLPRRDLLDHGTPCLGFALEEPTHINIWKTRLDELDLDVGPWLRDLKRAVLDDAPGATPIHALRRVGGRVTPATLPLEALREVAQTVPRQRFAYIVDVRNHEENASRIEHLAFGADVLFIECRFLEVDAEHAAQRNHLTAWQAGLLARRARVSRVVPCHFSPRYGGRSDALSKEAERAFRGSDVRDEIDTDLPIAT